MQLVQVGRTILVASALMMMSTLLWASGGGSEDPDPTGTKYFELTPSLTTNYQRDDGKVGFLSIGVQLKIKGTANVEKVKPHQPLLLDTLLWLVRGQTKDQIQNVEAREALRKDALSKINERLKEVAKSKKDLVEDVLFTKYVWQ